MVNILGLFQNKFEFLLRTQITFDPLQFKSISLNIHIYTLKAKLLTIHYHPSTFKFSLHIKRETKALSLASNREEMRESLGDAIFETDLFAILVDLCRMT